MYEALKFQTMLVAMGICALVVWVTTYIEYRDFDLNGKVAVVEPASKLFAPGNMITIEGIDKYQFMLKFKTETGNQIMIEPYLAKVTIEKITSGGQVEIVYLQNNPQRFIFKGEQLSKGYGWLFTGLSLIGVFIISLRLRRK